MIVECAQTKYHNNAMICKQEVNDSYENPTENIDYDLICARQGIALEHIETI